MTVIDVNIFVIYYTAGQRWLLECQSRTHQPRKERRYSPSCSSPLASASVTSRYRSCRVRRRSPSTHLEHVVSPGRHVEVEASGREVASVAIVAARTHQVLEAQRVSGQVGKREPYVALALVPGVVDGDQPSLAVPTLPTPAMKQSDVPFPSHAGAQSRRRHSPSRTTGCRSTVRSRS
jgi:hypothetical protein